MKKYLIVMLTVFVASCADENLKPIVTFDDAGHGAYPRLLSETGDKLLNLLTQADFDASSYGYSIRFIDDANGANVASYSVNVEYVSGGASLGPVEIKSFSASDFSNEGGNVVLNNVTITSADVTNAFGLSYSNLTAGDAFNITGVVVQNNGLIHTGATSSASVNGTAFQGHFDFTMPVACPSDLSGTYAYTNVSFCGGAALSGTLDIISLGAGVHTFSDNSFGSYQDCYGAGMTGGIKFTEVCTVVAFTSFDSQYGETWSYTTSIVGNDWLIQGTNVSFAGEDVNAVITFPNGVPFTLAP